MLLPRGRLQHQESGERRWEDAARGHDHADPVVVHVKVLREDDHEDPVEEDHEQQVNEVVPLAPEVQVHFGVRLAHGNLRHLKKLVEAPAQAWEAFAHQNEQRQQRRHGDEDVEEAEGAVRGEAVSHELLAVLPNELVAEKLAEGHCNKQGAVLWLAWRDLAQPRQDDAAAEQVEQISEMRFSCLILDFPAEPLVLLTITEAADDPIAEDGKAAPKKEANRWLGKLQRPPGPLPHGLRRIGV